MKKNLFALVLIFICLSGVAQWNFVGPAGISNGWTIYNDIAIDTTGSPVIVFFENGANIYKASCLRFNGSDWVQVESSTFQNFDVGDIIDFKIDKKNNYNLLFSDSKNYKYSCIRFDGKAWKFVGDQYITSLNSVNKAFGLDSTGLVFFVIEGYNGHLVFKEDGNSWKQLSSEGLGSGGLAFPKLEFDSNNKPVLAYMGPGFFANCSRFIDNKWVSVGNSNFSAAGYLARDINLHITQNDDFFMAFNDFDTRCFKLNKSLDKWELTGNATQSMYLSFGVEDIVSDDVKSNIYLVGNKGEKIRCYSLNGNEWIQVGDTAVSEGNGGYPRLSFNKKTGKLYCTYNDFNLSKAVVKEYSLPTTNMTISQNGQVKIFPNPAQGIFVIELSGQKFNVMICDINGHLISEYQDVSDRVKIDSNTFIKGIYIVRVIPNNGKLSLRKLIVI
jgi:hypothetical protein